VGKADNLTTFMCRLSCTLGASTSWNPTGLPRPVRGLLYLFTQKLASATCNEKFGGDKNKYQTRLQYQSAEITQVTPYLNDIKKRRGAAYPSSNKLVINRCLIFMIYDFTRKLPATEQQKIR
jgi:hypothetical protein